VNHGDAEGRDPHPLFETKFVRRQLGADFRGNVLAAYLSSRGAELQPHPMVDPAYIWEQQRLAAPSDASASLVFFLKRETNDLNPSREFNSDNYIILYPDTAGYNPFHHYVRYGIAEGRKTTKAKFSFRGLVSQTREMALIEPDLVDVFAARINAPLVELYDRRRVQYLLSARLAAKCGERRFAHVVLAPWLKRGGAERVIINLVKAILSEAGSGDVLILCTQSDVVDAMAWLPFTRRVTVASIHDVLDGADESYVAFCNWLQFMRCSYLYVVNSDFGWKLISKYGRSLKSILTILGFVFCYDYDEFGRRTGYAWTDLRRAVTEADALVTENLHAIEQFCTDHFLDSSDRVKFHCLYQPVDPKLRGRLVTQVRHNLAAGAERRHAVLWAARFDRQKGMELALEIAAGIPEVDFMFYGGAFDELPDGLAPLPANARIGGVFGEFSDLPLHEFSLLLHTSHWDGLPNVLLEGGAVGLPILATDVGGVSELIDDKTGWLVAHGAGAAAYHTQIERILRDPVEAIARSERLAARIDERHSMDAFISRAWRLLEKVVAQRTHAFPAGA
jgi:glycosyltransferase involved in cell wall biosynthesis